MSRNFDLSQAASNGVTVLPDLTVSTPAPGDVVSVGAVVSGQVFLNFTTPVIAADTYLPLAGGTMTGDLRLAHDPVTYDEATSKNYVDNKDAQLTLLISQAQSTATNAVLRAGDTMTGQLTLPFDPTLPLQAATKSYVDAKVAAGVGSGGAKITVADSPPALTQGALWFDSVSTQLFVGYIDPVGPGQWVVANAQANPVSNFLPLSGGTLTGALTLPADPTQDYQAATKHYIDQQLTLAGNYMGTWRVAVNDPYISGGGTVSNENYVAVTADPATPETAPPGVPGIGGMLINNGDRIIWASNLAVWQILRGAGINLGIADARYVQTSGSTMTGALRLSGDPTDALHPVTLQYFLANQSEGTISSVIAGTGLTGGGSAGAVTLALSTPVSLANGGTGGSTAGVAWTNIGMPNASVTTPLMDGVAAVGTGITWAYANHVHPTDTSRAPATGSTAYVAKTGDTMTGALTVDSSFGVTVGVSSGAGGGVLNLQTQSNYNLINARKGGYTRWAMYLGDNTAANDFKLERYNDSGAFQGRPLLIDRAVGHIQTEASLGLGMATKTDAAWPTLFTQGISVNNDQPIFWNAYWQAPQAGSPSVRLNDGYSAGIYVSNGEMQFLLTTSGAAGSVISAWPAAFRLRQDGYLNPNYLAVGNSTSGGGDPAIVEVANGNNARIRYHVSGTRIWSAGCDGSGQFVIADESAATYRLYFETSGNARFVNNVYVPAIEASGVVRASGGNIWMGDSTGSRVFQFQSNWYWDWNWSNGSLSWNTPGGYVIYMDSSRNTQFAGNLQCNGGRIICTNSCWGVQYISGAYATGHAFLFGWANVVGGAVTCSVDNGGAVVAFQNASDARLKTNITRSSFDCLDTLQRIPLHSYDWLDVPDVWGLKQARKARRLRDNPRRRIGMIAQEVQKVFADGVIAGDDFDDHLGRVWSLDQNNMIALLVGAVQQLTERVEELEQQV